MYDVIIIGAGIVGCATARALSRYALDILVIEKSADVAVGATKANSGILHAGYDCTPGTLKAKMNVRGLQLYQTLAQELAIPHRMNGSMVVSIGGDAGDDGGLTKLRQLYDQGITNDVTGMELLTAAQARALEPNLHPSVNGALRATSAGIISPYEAAIAFAENAAANGVRFLLETAVTDVNPLGPDVPLPEISDIGKMPSYVVRTTRHGLADEYHARLVINAAGTESGAVANRHRIHPQRGQYYLLDNTQRDLIGHTVFQLPTDRGKGVLIAPTVDGNVLLGPTAEAINETIDNNQSINDPAAMTSSNVIDTSNVAVRNRNQTFDTSNVACHNRHHATATTRDGLVEALDKARLTLSHIPIGDRITAFAGVRAKHADGDFILEEEPAGFIHAIGIDSPGLTAAPAIAQRLAEMALEYLAKTARKQGAGKREPVLKSDFIAQRAPIVRLRDLPPDAQKSLITSNPAYGAVVCRCETITQAEITEAMRRFAALQNPVAASQPVVICDPLNKSSAAIPANLDAIKRRSRAQMGRCQGGFCTVRLVELISREYAIPEAAVTKNGRGSEIVH